MPKHTVKNRQSFYKKRFLEKFVEYCVVGKAAQATGVQRSTVYNWLKEKQFSDEFEDARKAVLEKLEEEAFRRAIVGVDEPVGFYQGRSYETVKKFSDTLLIVLLKANAPEKYKDNVETKHSGEVTFKVQYDEPPAGYQFENRSSGSLSVAGTSTG